jgi:hypothetical protein
MIPVIQIINLIIFFISIIFSKSTTNKKLDLSLLNIDKLNDKCYYHYIKHVQINHSKKNKTTSFYDYLEYFWDLEESEEELYERICKKIMKEYPKKRYLRI